MDRSTTKSRSPGPYFLPWMRMMGGRDMPAFWNASNRIPFVRFLDMLMTSNLMSSCNIVFDNYQQPANDGMFLEAVMTATTCMASHAHGVRGGKLREFSTQLAYELTEQKTLNAPRLNLRSRSYLRQISSGL
uniref:Uncharacterized protein n=1 Tax=Spongospora subterranea TaxID=70186 RepID=A0A0H5RCL7_9EUKA|eukprot:CRZ06254.1 hypothetical protein [Spongospora subterranea]